MTTDKIDHSQSFEESKMTQSFEESKMTQSFEESKMTQWVETLTRDKLLIERAARAFNREPLNPEIDFDSSHVLNRKIGNHYRLEVNLISDGEIVARFRVAGDSRKPEGVLRRIK